MLFISHITIFSSETRPAVPLKQMYDIMELKIFMYLRGAWSNANQNQPLLRSITSVVNNLIVPQISCSLKHFHRLRITCRWAVLENQMKENSKNNEPATSLNDNQPLAIPKICTSKVR